MSLCRLSQAVRKPAASFHRAFTLIEVMVVVIILGVIASVFIAQFSTAEADSHRSSVASQLQSVRQQILVYCADHNDTYPDLVGQQWAQLTQPTNVTGAIEASGLGPYLPKLPQNPLNNNTTVVADISQADQNTGWVFDNTTGILSATNQTPTVLYDETTQTLQ